MVARKGALRAVSAGERAVKPLTLTEAARLGDTRQMLAATLDRIAVAVQDESTPARDLAALTKRLMETQREIEAFDARDEEAGSYAEVSDGEFDASAV